MNFRTTTSRKTFPRTSFGHQSQINDLQHNMDIARIPPVTEKDLESVEKYQKEYNLLLKILEEYKA